MDGEKFIKDIVLNLPKDIHIRVLKLALEHDDIEHFTLLGLILVRAKKLDHKEFMEILEEHLKSGIKEHLKARMN